MSRLATTTCRIICSVLIMTFYFQTSMSVTLPMEDVNRFVLMLLVASPAAVSQGTCWMEMGLIVQVIITDQHDAIFCAIVNYLLCFMQTSMSVRVMTPTTVMRMHSALTQREVSTAPATLATLEMESTVQVSSLYI